MPAGGGEHCTGSRFVSWASLQAKISPFHQLFMPAARTFLPLLCLSWTSMGPRPSIPASPCGLRMPHLPMGSPPPSPHANSQQNANVISTLQAGER